MQSNTVSATTPAPSAHTHSTTVLILSLILAIIGLFASDSYLPSLPDMTLALATTAADLQLTVIINLF